MLISNKPSILIVDDDLAILSVFRRIFERKGYSVTIAEKGEQAVKKLTANKFDIALIDFTLQDMEGTTLLPIIKKSSPKTLRIMLTGKLTAKDTAKEAQVFLQKPVDPEKLLSIINTKIRNMNSEE